ncbi:ComEA family DNA-binding protein [Dethiosulfovibrio sp. F2B]|uniref:ComEA family DNA-binding protein n=1 Tax=Dethiosulfovibrio faecalis TaxID=2720018 RepID=UPI001F1C1E07|nr:ComEA family DNA-binding protein [Dethiosulfovibrio faecalis]MCF4150825.1 ComEA family DNA-binding protein [Dethiosulfovibrio faecalis]
MKGKNRILHIGLILLGLVCFGGAGLMIRSFSGRWEGMSEPTSKAGPALSVKEAPRVEDDPAPRKGPEIWVVYVTGAVESPGVYHLPSGSRVYHLVESAGGMTSGADDVAVNLAAPLADGAHVHVPLRSKAVRAPIDTGRSGSSSSVTALSYAGTSSGSASARSGAVNLNSASLEELQTLPGIGPKTAAAILSYREKIGPFRSVDELTKVKGIGPKKLETVRALVTVR